MARTYDRVDAHRADAGSERGAAAHIACFLLWALERDLVAPDHRRNRRLLRKDPVDFVLSHCGAKLWSTDFSERGARFTEAYYGEFLEVLTDRGVDAALEGVEDASPKIGAAYAYASRRANWADLHACLDEALEEWESNGERPGAP